MLSVNKPSSLHAGRCLAIICGITGAVSLAVGAGEADGRPPKSILAVYGHPTAGHDNIRVSEGTDGKIRVTLKLYYANGHTCYLNKDGEWHEDRLTVVADSLDPSHPCRLSLYFDKSGVLLKDEGLQCAPVYCGTRGKLDDVSLPKMQSNRK